MYTVPDREGVNSTFRYHFFVATKSVKITYPTKFILCLVMISQNLKI